jgi:tRNA A-37 threonylcarbamoyl transferase component Bud32
VRESVRDESVLSLEQARRIDPVCDRFEIAWQTGSSPRIEAFLEGWQGADRLALLRELILLDVHFRRAGNEACSAADYLPRFAELDAAWQAGALAKPADATTVPSPREPSGAARPAWPEVPGYEVHGELGRGGMGVVFKARHLALNRIVALKMIRATTVDEEDRQRFRTETEAVARLQHPNIVQIYEVGEHQGQPYCALEYCAGGSLSAALAGNPLPPREAAQLTETLARAITHAHKAGIVHRDLKPANVLLATESTENTEKKRGLSSVPSVSSVAGLFPKLTDFGLAKKLDSEVQQTRTGAVMGTPSYMAPEQACGAAVGPLADVYALGAVLYELLTGRPPFKAATVFDTLLLVTSAEPVPVRHLQPSVPPDLETVCLKCLEKEPAKRLGSALELAEELERFQAGQAIRSRAVGSWERLVKWAKRRPAVAALGGSLVLATLLLLGALVAGFIGTRMGLEEAEQAWGAEAEQRGRAEGALQVAKDKEAAERRAAEAARLAKAAAEQAKEKAERRLQQIEKANEILTAIFHDLNPQLEEKGSPPLLAQLGEQLDKAAKLLDGEAVGDPLMVARLQLALGHAQLNLGYAEAAAQVFSKALATFTQLLDPYHPDTLGSMNNLAAAYRAAGMLDLALPLYLEILKKMKAKLDPDHLDTLRTMNNLAEVYHADGKLDLALPLLVETLEKRKAKLGVDDPATLRSMNNLAEAYRDAGQLDLALRLSIETLEKRKAKLGSDHHDTLRSMNSLALAYRAASKLDLALALFVETVEKMKGKLGPNHPDTLTTMNNLAEVYRAVGKLGLAVPLPVETLEKRKAKLGPDHPDTLISMGNLALAYRTAGILELALPLSVETLDRMTAKLGPYHRHTLQSMNNLATAYWAARKLDHSVPLFEKTLRLRKEKLGPDHLDTVHTMANLAVNYRDAGRLREAIHLFDEVLTKIRSYKGPIPAQLAWVPAVAVAAYEQDGQFAKAEPHYRSLLEQARKQFGPNDLRTGPAMAQLGLNLVQQKKNVEAESLLRDCLKIREQKQPDAWTTFSTKSLLGASLLGQKKYAEAEPLLLSGYEGMKQRAAQIAAAAKFRLVDAAQRLVDLYEGWDRPEAAALWRKTVDAERAKLPSKQP